MRSLLLRILREPLFTFAIIGGVMALRIDRDRRVGAADAPLATPQPVPRPAGAG